MADKLLAPVTFTLPAPLPHPNYNGFAIYVLADGRCLLVAARAGEVVFGGIYTPFEVEQLAEQLTLGASYGRRIAAGEPLAEREPGWQNLADGPVGGVVAPAPAKPDDGTN